MQQLHTGIQSHNSSFWGLNALFWPLQALGTYTYMQAKYTNTEHKMKNKHKKKSHFLAFHSFFHFSHSPSERNTMVATPVEAS
jgi:hypothetical protein